MLYPSMMQMLGLWVGWCLLMSGNVVHLYIYKEPAVEPYIAGLGVGVLLLLEGWRYIGKRFTPS